MASGERRAASGTAGRTADGQAGERVRLTALSHGAGCACKLPLSALDQLMATLGTGPGSPGGLVPATGDLLVGAAEGDDAAVLRLDEDRALVLTTDFFTPIVDDPRDWGRVAATNALSDVYAMGGRPVIALNLTAWPGSTLPVSMLADVLRGGAGSGRGRGLPGGRGPHDRRPRAQVRAGRRRDGRSAEADDRGPGPGRRRARPDQAARHRRGGHGAQARRGAAGRAGGGGRRHDHAERGGQRGGAGAPGWWPPPT